MANPKRSTIKMTKTYLLFDRAAGKSREVSEAEFRRNRTGESSEPAPSPEPVKDGLTVEQRKTEASRLKRENAELRRKIEQKEAIPGLLGSNAARYAKSLTV
jgi:hypothetical protein